MDSEVLEGILAKTGAAVNGNRAGTAVLIVEEQAVAAVVGVLMFNGKAVAAEEVIVVQTGAAVKEGAEAEVGEVLAESAPGFCKGDVEVEQESGRETAGAAFCIKF